ncbi:MAG: hypothetical protein C0403_09460 [Desulfobacterium sp.]|nr:hypothetical protein [Desulfobacterium sp.]
MKTKPKPIQMNHAAGIPLSGQDYSPGFSIYLIFADNQALKLSTSACGNPWFRSPLLPDDQLLIHMASDIHRK